MFLDLSQLRGLPTKKDALHSDSQTKLFIVQIGHSFYSFSTEFLPTVREEI